MPGSGQLFAVLLELHDDLPFPGGAMALFPSAPWSSFEVGHSQIPASESPFQASADGRQQKPPGVREQEREPQEIREDPGSEEEGASNQDGQPVEEGTSREAAPDQLALDFPERPEAFQAGQGSTSQSGGHHQAHGGPETYHLTDLDQEEKLQERYPDEEQGQA